MVVTGEALSSLNSGLICIIIIINYSGLLPYFADCCTGTPADTALMFPLPLHWNIVRHSDSQDTGSLLEFYKYKTFIDLKKGKKGLNLPFLTSSGSFMMLVLGKKSFLGNDTVHDFYSRHCWVSCINAVCIKTVFTTGEKNPAVLTFSFYCLPQGIQ